MVAFRLYLGTQTRDGVPVSKAALAICYQLVAATWSSFTAYDVTGVWEGSAETAIVFESMRVDTPGNRVEARELARELARQALQTCVGLTTVPVMFELVSP